jgi:acyl carrier protein
MTAMRPSEQKAPSPPDQAAIAGDHLLSVVRAVLDESRQRRDPASTRVTLDMDFDRDLGMDSLARVELLSRIEKRYGVLLDDRVFTEARTPRALLQALSRAGEFAPGSPAAPIEAPAARRGRRRPGLAADADRGPRMACRPSPRTRAHPIL